MAPLFDLAAETEAGLVRISVKSLRAGNGKNAAYWRFQPDGYDWLALVRINTENGQRDIFIIPYEKVVELSSLEPGGLRRLKYKTPALEAYRNNFALRRFEPFSNTLTITTGNLATVNWGHSSFCKKLYVKPRG